MVAHRAKRQHRGFSIPSILSRREIGGQVVVRSPDVVPLLFLQVCIFLTLKFQD